MVLYWRVKWVKFVIDGVMVEDIMDFASFEDLNSYLDLWTAEDIKGIEVNASRKYSGEYIRRFIPAEQQMMIDFTRFDFAFIEITTRSGKGPNPQHTPGVYYYKGLPFGSAATFYSPRYTVKDTSDHTVDARSTIYWQPNVITGVGGKANIFFYAADKPGTYTVTVEGTDFNGNVAVQTRKIKIATPK